MYPIDYVKLMNHIEKEGIELLDFLILGEGRYITLKEQGLL